MVLRRVVLVASFARFRHCTPPLHWPTLPCVCALTWWFQTAVSNTAAIMGAINVGSAITSRRACVTRYDTACQIVGICRGTPIESRSCHCREPLRCSVPDSSVPRPYHAHLVPLFVKSDRGNILSHKCTSLPLPEYIDISITLGSVVHQCTLTVTPLRSHTPLSPSHVHTFAAATNGGSAI